MNKNFVHIVCSNGVIAVQVFYIGDDAWWNGNNWQSLERVEYWYCVGFYTEGTMK